MNTKNLVLQRVMLIMNKSYNLSADELSAMSEITRALAEQMVLIFGEKKDNDKIN